MGTLLGVTFQREADLDVFLAIPPIDHIVIRAKPLDAAIEHDGAGMDLVLERLCQQQDALQHRALAGAVRAREYGQRAKLQILLFVDGLEIVQNPLVDHDYSYFKC